LKHHLEHLKTSTLEYQDHTASANSSLLRSIEKRKASKHTNCYFVNIQDRQFALKNTLNSIKKTHTMSTWFERHT